MENYAYKEPVSEILQAVIAPRQKGVISVSL